MHNIQKQHWPNKVNGLYPIHEPNSMVVVNQTKKKTECQYVKIVQAAAKI